MPDFRSLADFGAQLDKLGRDLDGAGARRITKVMGDEAQKLATAAASADLGGDPKFSGWAPVLETKVRQLDASSAMLTPTRSSAGPFTVAEFGRNQKAGPRQVGPRLTKTGRISKAKTKRWNGRTDPKHTASKAVTAIEREIPKVVERELPGLLRKYFDLS